jgi:hypothetical protein
VIWAQNHKARRMEQRDIAAQRKAYGATRHSRAACRIRPNGRIRHALKAAIASQYAAFFRSSCGLFAHANTAAQPGYRATARYALPLGHFPHVSPR